MATETAVHGDEAERASPDVTQVDPRAPRFGQTLTASFLLLGIALREPLLVVLVAVALNTALLSGWRVDPWGLLWKHLALPVVGPPEEREPAAPHRFAKLLGAVGTAAATVLVVAGFPTAGYVIAGVVAAAAGLAAVTGICIGCRMYRQVSFFRRLDVL